MGCLERKSLSIDLPNRIFCTIGRFAGQLYAQQPHSIQVITPCFCSASISFSFILRLISGGNQVHRAALYAFSTADAGTGGRQFGFFFCKAKDRVVLLEYRQRVVCKGKPHHGTAHQNFTGRGFISAAKGNNIANGRANGNDHIARPGNGAAVNGNALAYKRHACF